jgi:hypothetical protein
MQQRTADVNPLAVAKRQIARTGQAGLGLARAGTMLGAAWFVLLLGILVVFSLMTLGR